MAPFPSMFATRLQPYDVLLPELKFSRVFDGENTLVRRECNLFDEEIQHSRRRHCAGNLMDV